MDKHTIVGVHITERVQHATEVQQILTKHGCSIRTRLGLHEAAAGVCSPNGMILLEMTPDDAATADMMNDLKAIAGVEVQTMVFEHP